MDQLDANKSIILLWKSRKPLTYIVWASRLKYKLNLLQKFKYKNINFMRFLLYRQ